MSTLPVAEGSYPPVHGEDEIEALDILRVLVENIRMLVVVPLVAGLLALAISFFIPPTFTATTKFLPPQQQQSSAAGLLQSLGALGSVAGAAAGIKNPTDQYVAFLKSRSVQDALIDRYGLVEQFKVEFKQDARRKLEAMTRIVGGKDGLISIEVDARDPKLAAQYANAYVEQMGLLLDRLAVTEAQQRRVFFEKQLGFAKVNLVKSEQALKSSGLNSSALKASPQAAVEGLAKLKASISVQEVKIAAMRGYLNEAAPDFRQAVTELAALKLQLNRADKEEIVSVPDASDYISKFRDFKYNETLFELFAKQYEIARIDESREGAVVQVVDYALVPEWKSSPKKAKIAAVTSLLVGFLLLIWIFVKGIYQSSKENPKWSAVISAWRRSPDAQVR